MILNKEQKNAVYTKKRFVLLLAGAGSGKTRVIIERMKYLISSLNINPKRILGITFTKKSANEMKERVHNNDINIMTFHSFCYREIFPYIKPLVIAEDVPFSSDEVLEISNYKNTQKGFFKPLSYYKYQDYLKENNLIDFDDLEEYFLNQAKLDQTFSQKLENLFDYIFIDEFQDINNKQYQILKCLVGPNTSLFAVGDPDQSIYRFRGANPQIISTFLNQYQAFVMFILVNYRSTNEILDYANFVINKNKDRPKKNLLSDSVEHGFIEFQESCNQEEELKYLIHKIELLKKEFKLTDIAILARTHYRFSHLKETLDDKYQNKINILTIHESKGLEFEVVFIVGLEKKLFPESRENRISELYEERRLLFVAITRAKRRLIILSFKGQRSEFIREYLIYKR